MQKFLAYFVLATILITGWSACSKDDPNPSVDNSFYFNCKVNGTVWSAQQLTDPAIAAIIKIDSMPTALIRNDSLIIGAMAALGTDTSAVILIAKISNTSDVTGTYTFDGSISQIGGTGKAIGVYAGKKTDFIAYLLNPSAFKIKDGAQLKITKHANNKLSGEFNFIIQNLISFTDLYNVSEGKFQNLQIR